MLHHVSVGVADVTRAAEFYDSVLAALGYKRLSVYLPYAIGYGSSAPAFWIQLPADQKSASVGNGAHVGFSAKTKNAVHKFHEAALAKGGRDNGAPGPRADYGPDYYGAFVIDLDGNKLEATLHAEEATSKAAAKPKAKTKKAKAPARKAAKKATKKPAKKKAKRR
jgi:catechol 2,3-dioxygenase-like lactoylglutathione lyase family enzyme